MRTIIYETYEIIGSHTPLKTDCGELCGGICCKGDKAGMLLFPGEENIFAGVPGFVIEDMEYMGVSGVKLLICDGKCKRDIRPLACRIFPCIPHIGGDGGITAAADIRGRRMCPVWDLKQVEKSFIKAVRQAFLLLAKDEKQSAFMRLLSSEQDLLRKFYRK
jgi:hypothetical protein